MCNSQLKYIITLLFLTLITGFASAQDDDGWREQMTKLVYSPRYFGPNGFPIPELRSGKISDRWEIEARGEYHSFSGDRTKDVYARIFIPIANGRAGFEVSDVFYEYYNTEPETVVERHAAGTSWKNGAHGDVIVSSFCQVLKSEKWFDLMVEATLKTASGDRLADARYTDAASYWFTLNAGRNLCKTQDESFYLRMQGFIGFYCWMTNDLVHRQNDAITYSAGLSSAYKGLSLFADIAGIYGYEDNGDRPMQLRTKLNYEYKKNCISLRYKHGMKDCLYDSLSAAYIRYF